MKQAVRFLIGLLVVAILAYITSLATGNEHMWRGMRQSWMRGVQNAQVDDLQFQQTHNVAATDPKPWPRHSRYGEAALTPAQTDSTQADRTVGIALIHRDSLLFEWINPDIPGADTLRCNSFSAAKTLTALAIGAAEDRGLLSTKDRVSIYLPRFKGGSGGKLTINELLQMRSNIPFGESYKDPFGFMAKCYYGQDVFSLLPPYEVDGRPGAPWKYQGGNTLILHEILLKVTGETLSDWFSKTLWGPSGAVQDAKWAVDSKGVERNFAAFYANALDFAKLGNMTLNRGVVDGKRVLSEGFIKRMTTPIGKLSDGSDIQHYGYQTWLGSHRGHSFYVYLGLHGQYVICIPDLELVYVRMGFERIKEKHIELDVQIYHSVDIAMGMVAN